jgi:hypothetical protein
MIKRSAALSVLVLALVSPMSSSSTSGEKYKVADRAKVYFGFVDAFTTPAVVDSARVLESLPPMKRIRDEKVTKESAKWHLLISDANNQFQRVLKNVAKSGGYDLIAEVGSVSGPRAVPNITDEAIALAARG